MWPPQQELEARKEARSSRGSRDICALLCPEEFPSSGTFDHHKGPTGAGTLILQAEAPLLPGMPQNRTSQGRESLPAVTSHIQDGHRRKMGQLLRQARQQFRVLPDYVTTGIYSPSFGGFSVMSRLNYTSERETAPAWPRLTLLGPSTSAKAKLGDFPDHGCWQLPSTDPGEHPMPSPCQTCSSGLSVSVS